MPDDSSDTCGWMIKRCIYPDAASVAKALANSIIGAFQSAEKDTAPHALMLAGGRTPKAAYQLVADSGIKIPWNMHLIISDERWVPLDHPDSNFLMMTPFMNAIGCKPEQKIMVNTALLPDEAAADFSQRLDAYFQRNGILDTGYLGLGSDGHTASLFNETHLKSSMEKSAISVDRPDGRIGISATPSIIQKAQRIVFVVTGRDKKEMAARLLKSPRDITAGNVVFRHPNIELWMDRDATE